MPLATSKRMRAGGPCVGAPTAVRWDTRGTSGTYIRGENGEFRGLSRKAPDPPPPPVRFYVYGAVIPAQGIEPRLIGPLALAEAEHHRPFLGLKWTYQSTCGKWQFLGL